MQPDSKAYTKLMCQIQKAWVSAVVSLVASLKKRCGLSSLSYIFKSKISDSYCDCTVKTPDPSLVFESVHLLSWPRLEMDCV